jgi:amylosucrase
VTGSTAVPDALAARVDSRLPVARALLERLYGADHEVDLLLDRLLAIVSAASAARSDDLRALDRRRERTPDWFCSERLVGYVCYVDRFAGTLEGVAERLDYLEELGIGYLHLMPLLEPRPGPNDGGYAVADYRAVDPRVGDMNGLERLATELRGRGMSLCLDLVVNHTAPEHPWAERARDGDEAYRRYYLTFPDRTLPDAYERTLRHVFPDAAPGNFRWVGELEAWVWTTFHDYQWDLDFRNPDVFAAMLETMLFLANRGVECLRLDAVPFMWKELGTSCENRPEVHLLLQAFRAFVGMAAPATIFKAEAIVAPWELTKYLGADAGRHADECQIAYNNQLMVVLWSALAERHAALATVSLERLEPSPDGTTWATYVRGHDDIGWAVTDENAGAVGLDAFLHRSFLNEFYSGDFDGSFARGAIFQPEPATGDARISGTAASLVGIEQALALDDATLLEAGVRRLLLLYAVAYSYGGLPLVYMGDELALRSDRAYASAPEQAGDNRWLHRPAMDWAVAARRSEPGTLEARVFGALRRLGEARAGLPALHGSVPSTPLRAGEAVLAYLRSGERGERLLGLANVSNEPQLVPVNLLRDAGLLEPRDALGLGAVRLEAAGLVLPALTPAWLI